MSAQIIALEVSAEAARQLMESWDAKAEAEDAAENFAAAAQCHGYARHYERRWHATRGQPALRLVSTSMQQGA